MKKVLITLLISVSCVLSQSITAKQDKWLLAGAMKDISLMNISKNCSLFLFNYETQKLYQHSGQTVDKYKMIKAGNGFWAYGLNGDCQITDKAATQSTQTSDTSIKDGVTYELIFNATWSKETHPNGFPSNPHFSPLIGMVSAQDNRLYNRGAQASAGIKLMAETGSTSALETEIQAMNGVMMIKGTPLTSPGTTKVTFKADSTRSFLSIVSMIAPSPDWFIAASAVSLKDESGKWITEKTIELKLYDAGTDSGDTFSAANQATNPKGVITLLSETAVGFQNGVPIVGTFTIRKMANY